MCFFKPLDKWWFYWFCNSTEQAEWHYEWKSINGSAHQEYLKKEIKYYLDQNISREAI